MVFAYDANGSRTNKSTTIGGTTSVSSYTYDEDNRLIATALNGTAITHIFEYDYRSRRYYRSTPTTPHMYSVFDGGLSIQIGAALRSCPLSAPNSSEAKAWAAALVAWFTPSKKM